MANEKEQLDDKELEKINGGYNHSVVGDGSGKSFFKCDFCGETFDDKKNYNNHMKKLHKIK